MRLVKCRLCGGSGERGGKWRRDDPCHQCHGTGKVADVGGGRK
jgi:DnaJ-class molecular chaperone